MEDHTENINRMLNKLKVLESRIQKLESMTNEVFLEVETEYWKKLKKMTQKKEEALQLIIKMKESDHNS
jgi:hypothetical protein